MNDTENCNGNFTSSEGVLTSPSYPSHYHNDADCIYLVSLLVGTHMQISITNMDIEYTTDDYDYLHENFDYHQFDGMTCFDFLELRDGKSRNSPLIGKYCGDSDVIPLPLTLLTSGEFLWLRLVIKVMLMH